MDDEAVRRILSGRGGHCQQARVLGLGGRDELEADEMVAGPCPMPPLPFGMGASVWTKPPMDILVRQTCYNPNSDPSIRSDITRHFNQSVVILLAIADLTHTAECDHDDERVRFGNVVAAQPFAMIPDDLVILSSLFDLSA